MSAKVNLAMLAALVVSLLIAVFVASNPTTMHELQLRAMYMNRVVKLPVPYFHQEHSLSCEIACLKMALNYQGAKVSEQDLIKRLPFDATPKGTETWGDPNKGFVGDIDGTMGANGYGVYWEPIAEVGRHWRKTEILEDGSAQDIAANILAKRPVIIWGYAGAGNARIVEWRTALGKKVAAVSSEHARVVTGFAGGPQHPEVFFISDPYLGEVIWTREELEKNWHALGNHGVIVYAEETNGTDDK